MPPGLRHLSALALLLLSLAVAPSPLRAQSGVTPPDLDFRIGDVAGSATLVAP